MTTPSMLAAAAVLISVRGFRQDPATIISLEIALDRANLDMVSSLFKTQLSQYLAFCAKSYGNIFIIVFQAEINAIYKPLNILVHIKMPSLITIDNHVEYTPGPPEAEEKHGSPDKPGTPTDIHAIFID